MVACVLWVWSAKCEVGSIFWLCHCPISPVLRKIIFITWHMSCNQILIMQRITIYWVFSFALSRFPSFPVSPLWCIDTSYWRRDRRRCITLRRLEGHFCSQLSGWWEQRAEVRHRHCELSTPEPISLAFPFARTTLPDCWSPGGALKRWLAGNSGWGLVHRI